MTFMIREFILTGSCCLYTGSLEVALEELPELDWGTAYGLLYWVEVTGSPTMLWGPAWFWKMAGFLRGEELLDWLELVTGVEVVTYCGGQINCELGEFLLSIWWYDKALLVIPGKPAPGMPGTLLARLIFWWCMTCPPPCGGSGGLKIRRESINFVNKRIMATFNWYSITYMSGGVLV